MNELVTDNNAFSSTKCIFFVALCHVAQPEWQAITWIFKKVMVYLSTQIKTLSTEVRNSERETSR